MTDGWVALPSPQNHATWANYKHKVELRIRPLGGDRYEIALLRQAGPLFSDAPPDVFVAVVTGMRKAATKARWVKDNVADLLQAQEESLAESETAIEAGQEVMSE